MRAHLRPKATVPTQLQIPTNPFHTTSSNTPPVATERGQRQGVPRTTPAATACNLLAQLIDRYLFDTFAHRAASPLQRVTKISLRMDFSAFLTAKARPRDRDSVTADRHNACTNPARISIDRSLGITPHPTSSWGVLRDHCVTTRAERPNTWGHRLRCRSRRLRERKSGSGQVTARPGAVLHAPSLPGRRIRVFVHSLRHEIGRLVAWRLWLFPQQCLRRCTGSPLAAGSVRLCGSDLYS